MCIGVRLCYQPVHMELVWLAVGGGCVFSLGTLVFLFWRIWRLPRGSRHGVAKQSMYGYFYTGLKPDWWWWDIVTEERLRSTFILTIVSAALTFVVSCTLTFVVSGALTFVVSGTLTVESD